MTRINYSERKNLIESLRAEQKGRLEKLPFAERSVLRSEQGKREERKGKLFFKLEFSPASDVIAIHFGQGIVSEIRHNENADAFYNYDIMGDLMRIDLPMASKNFDMRNEHLLPLKKEEKKAIDLRYDKGMDVLYISFGEKSPVTSEKHPDMYGVVRDYDEKGRIVGYAIAEFSKFFYRGNEDIPELFFEINNEKK